MNETITQFIGIGAGVLTSFSMLPQLIKIIRTKEAEAVSGKMIITLLAGLALWISYGVLKSDIPIIATNAFSFILNIVLLYFNYKYSKDQVV